MLVVLIVILEDWTMVLDTSTRPTPCKVVCGPGTPSSPTPGHLPTIVKTFEIPVAVFVTLVEELDGVLEFNVGAPELNEKLELLMIISISLVVVRVPLGVGVVSTCPEFKVNIGHGG